MLFFFLFSEFALFTLTLDSLIIMFYGKVVFALYLPGDLWASCIWLSKSHAELGKFSIIISLNRFSKLFDLSFSLGIPIIHKFSCSTLSQMSWRLYLFFFYFFLCFYLTGLFQKSCLQVLKFFLLFGLVFYKFFWMYFVFPWMYFEFLSPEFVFFRQRYLPHW